MIIKEILNKTEEQIQKEILDDLKEVKVKKISTLLFENAISTKLTFVVDIQKCFKIYMLFNIEHTKDFKIINITASQKIFNWDFVKEIEIEYKNENCKQFENEIKNEKNKIFESFLIENLEIKDFKNNLKEAIIKLNNICNKCN